MIFCLISMATAVVVVTLLQGIYDVHIPILFFFFFKKFPAEVTMVTAGVTPGELGKWGKIDLPLSFRLRQGQKELRGLGRGG